MKFIQTTLPGVVLITPDVFKDDRGFFLETYQKRKYDEGGVSAIFVQDNHSKSVKNTLRGLHLQVRKPQAKLVRVLQGEIADIVVDVRPASATFKKWEMFKLSSENFQQVFVPEGYAHGFVVISDVAEVEYKCTQFYFKEDELTIRWDDPQLAIRWPVAQPILSEKDKKALSLNDALSVLR